MRQKLILDTDIGSDIDDAVCLAYLLANPDCQLLGITTVTGEGQKRAEMASALCRIAGKDVPIFIGAEEPLVVAQRQPHAPQAAVLPHWSHATSFTRGEAVRFLQQTIRAHPGEITLLTIGPLTNIALLFKADPEIPALLKGLVMMAGVFTHDRLEWNALLDPHASAIVYRTSITVHRSIGLDVTLQVKLPAKEVRQRFQAPLLRPVLDFAEVWFQEREEIVFHDPLAATTIFDPQICTFQRGRVKIELGDPERLGQTHWQPGNSGGHEVAAQVNPQRFFAHFFGMF
ncbi:MAG TPA: nucleoside hydrolase [Chloroflexi bacterium]|nr:nucleoside hydrolase [Chloroflexota bacterium]HBY06650.1 nucleoside hydrolase [Chloroflexota bacterium]